MINYSKIVADKIVLLIREGYPHKKAVAIALDLERRGKLGKALEREDDMGWSSIVKAYTTKTDKKADKEEREAHGPYYGPGKGGKIGKYADPQHKVVWDEDKHGGSATEQGKKHKKEEKKRALGWSEKEVFAFLKDNPKGVTLRAFKETFGLVPVVSHVQQLQEWVKEGKIDHSDDLFKIPEPKEDKSKETGTETKKSFGFEDVVNQNRQLV